MPSRLKRSRSCACFAVLAGFLLHLPAQAQISLGSAQSFGVLSGSAVTNTGPTLIHGSLGLSPGTALTGFPPGSVMGGTVHLNDASAAQAQNDLTTAYNAIAGTACNVDLSGQDLGGLTLTPGVYCFSSSAQLTGTLTLNALGNPNAVFIFKMGSALTTASNASVQVIGGGNNCNVFWQVGSSATLGTGSAFVGNVLALSSITLTTGASVTGRILARNGAVTLDSNLVSSCGPAGVCPTLTVNPASLPNGIVGTLYAATISASGGSPPYSFAVSSGALPTGLLLDPASGSISGLPTTAGSFSFTITAIDANGCPGSRAYALVLTAPGCPEINIQPSTLPASAIGAPYNQTLSASGGTAPYVFTLLGGLLPSGLQLDGSSGVLSGRPTTAGQFSFTIGVTDANNCPGSRPFAIVIPFLTGCPAIVLQPMTLPVPALGVSYRQVLVASGGSAPYTYTLSGGALPAGLTLDATSGVLSGIPLALGPFSFTVSARDGNACPGSRTYQSEVRSASVALPGLGDAGMLLLILLVSAAAWSSGKRG